MRYCYGTTIGLIAKLGLIVFLGLSPIPAADNGVVIWGSIQDDIAVLVGSDPVGNIIVAGITANSDDLLGDPGVLDALLLKYDRNRDLMWAKTWGPIDIQIEGWHITPIGDVFMSGCTYDSAADECIDVLIVKFDANGTFQWSKTWDGGGVDDADSIGMDPSGDLYVTGGTSSFGGRHVLLLKYKADGELVWAKTWGRSELFSADSANDLAIDDLGNVYLGGNTTVSGGKFDALILKCCDAMGNFNWAKTWGDSGAQDDAFAMAVHNSGPVYVMGNTDGFGVAGPDVFLLQFDPNGTMNWSRAWGGANTDRGAGVSTDDIGNVYLTGSTDSFNGFELFDAFLLKFAPNGELQLAKKWDGSDDDVFAVVNTRIGSSLFVPGGTRGASGVLMDVTGNLSTSIGSAISLPGSTVVRNGIVGIIEGPETILAECLEADCGVDALLVERTKTCIHLSSESGLSMTLAHDDCEEPVSFGPVDIIRGDIGQLSFSGDSVDLGSVTCVKADLNMANFMDLSPSPNSGEGFFFLATDSTFGTSSSGAPRNMMVPNPPCP